MQWRLSKYIQGWVIEYKEGLFDSWTQVKDARHFSFEPSTPKFFNSKDEAAAMMGRLIAKYS